MLLLQKVWGQCPLHRFFWGGGPNPPCPPGSTAYVNITESQIDRDYWPRFVHSHSLLGNETTTTQCKLLEHKWSMCASGWKEKHHQCKECLRQWLKGKRHQHKSQPVTTTMCASGVLALVDRKMTPQAQGPKVRAQGANVRTEGAIVRTSISASQ